MLLSKGSVKLRSLGLSTFVLTLAMGALGVAGTGCIFVDDHHGHGDESMPDPGDPDPPQDQISQVAIEADQALSANPGEGVGIFVEYRSGGEWHIWTTCDTFTSKVVCGFDIFAATHPDQLRGFAADQLEEGQDSLIDLGNGEIELRADTDSETDGMTVQTDPGAVLDLEVYLDANSAQPFVYWVSDGVIHTGAPSNPVEFIPQTP